jgi:uncharacterized membrane protein
MDYGVMGGYAWVWMTLGLAFWIGVISLVVWAVTRTLRNDRPAATAEEILRRRYASGEIGESEFESTRRTLRHS